MNKDAVILSEEELNVLCREWQETLRLQNWEIEVSIARGRDMPLEGCKATCEANLQRAHALIYILDPLDYDDRLPQDMESDLVHELVHIHLWPFDHTEPGNLENDSLERAVIQISWALVNLNRKAMPRTDLTEVLIKDGNDNVVTKLRGVPDDDGPELQAS